MQVLTGIDHIAFPAAVTDADVKEAIGTERDLAAVVVAIRVVDLHDDLRAVGVSLVGVLRGDVILGDERRAVEPEVGIADVELAVLLEVRVELDAV